MPYMTEAHQADPVVPMQDSPKPTPAIGNAMRYNIKRVGGRPMTFEGVELGMAMSFSPEHPYWYEFNIFRKIGGFVLTVKRFHVAEDETDFCRAWEFDTIDQAMDALETYDAAQDVRADKYLPHANASAAELAAASMQLKAEIADSRTHFSSLVGEFLHDLGAAT